VSRSLDCTIAAVTRSCYRNGVQGSYNFTLAGVRNAEQHGVSLGEIWEVINSDGLLYSPVGGNRTVIFGATSAGRHLAVLVEEDEFEDDTYDIVAVREMVDREVSELRKLRGGGDEQQ
jgi:uncharacterized DUF497 family protein